jgi:hypothetical protein
MPRIQWTGLPPALRDHLLDRLRELFKTVESIATPCSVKTKGA